MMMSPSRLTIFEGPDGAGKTTAAEAFAGWTGAKYIHLGPSPKILGPELAFEYIHAMMPALRGTQAVVMDRCWLSEKPYGDAFRGGKDRLGPKVCDELELLALQCVNPAVVMCLPAFETVRANYMARRASEMLDTPEQLGQVYKAYQGILASRLPQQVANTFRYDYESETHDRLFKRLYGR